MDTSPHADDPPWLTFGSFVTCYSAPVPDPCGAAAGEVGEIAAAA